MNGRLGDLSSFIQSMLDEERGQYNKINKSKKKKKKRVQRELDKLTFSVNYKRKQVKTTIKLLS